MSLPFLLDPKAECIPPSKGIAPKDKWKSHRRPNQYEMWEHPTWGDIISHTAINDCSKRKNHHTNKGMTINRFFEHTAMNVITHTHNGNEEEWNRS